MKRRLAQLVVFLLLGAVVNVAVAWGCALWAPMVSSGPNSRGEYSKLAPGMPWPRSVPADWPSLHSGSWGVGWVMTTGTFSGNIPEDQAIAEGRPSLYGLSVILLGVPFRTLECQFQMQIYEPYRRIDTMIAAIYSPEIISSSGSMGCIPLRPIFPGFAINTVVYAVILWMLWSSPFKVRRMIRNKRGRCIKCGYDLRGTSEGGCPECGWGREAEA